MPWRQTGALIEVETTKKTFIPVRDKGKKQYKY